MPKIKEKRMKALEHMDNVFLWKNYNSANPFPKGTWNSHIFKNDNPIVLELACGKGEYSVGLGEMHPKKNFVGFDLKGNRIWVGATSALEKKLDNVRFFRAYIDHLYDFFAPNEVDEIWIIFPDPQLKKDRKKLTSPKFLDVYRPLLKPGGTINLKTDSPELYEFTLETINELGLKLHRNVEDVHRDRPDDPELQIRTYYEGMHLERGRTIRFLSFSLD
ncbi:MAG: tRNA (guanosine(46)-N7)-methyltransferase TrmB [Balneolaceae bacterium]|nr:tRNA (guanosine(46)-N7)-methyltransferase TrmB [Balneolaceae bacterium]